ncbi:Fur family transcriptional regulator [Lachnoclostridium sp. Marseille-P6806]|uniref:Fur family transcriptional regulator n=1 Tax=Lachnoclostridium sp. Marseille-P6806 TaxID=2364793 RepID=UPI0010313560|nr:transcriptional repressor [Lachnoclostridium sp. Marseille-P6806]
MIRKHSRQRDAIYDFLQGRTDHPTADLIYLGVREKLPNISLGTVYRNLMVLRDAGLIRTVDVGDGVIHFDPDISEHNHFVCQSCGCVQDLDMKSIDLVKDIAAENFRGRITGYSAYFYGVCEDCLKKQSEQKEKVQ